MVSENESVRLIFGLKIKDLRQQKQLGYQQLAQQAGMAVSYLHDIEAGKKYPKADKILALAKVLGVDYDYLVSLHAGKKLQPLIDLINSDFINAVPWVHFGLTPASLLDLFANTPDKITAFIHTLLKISRSYQLSKESFYNSALRSYQDLRDNYFEEVEEAVKLFREQHSLNDILPVPLELLEAQLGKINISINRKRMQQTEALQNIRSYYSASKQILFLNKGLSAAQEKFLQARELGFQFMQIKERTYETMIQQTNSFDKLLNNFKASYFAVALLIPEEQFTEAIKRIVMQPLWDAKPWLQLLQHYDVTPEMLMQRLTNILPKHFASDHLFFIRMSGDVKKNHFEMTKELHLSQLHNPYANALNEHYCRRWVSIDSLKQVAVLQEKKKFRQPLIDVQISQYWQTHNRYFVFSFAKPKSKTGDEMVSVSIGLLIDQKLQQRMPFVNDRSIPVKTVHTTCERCGITDCKERAAPPSVIEKEERQKAVEVSLNLLNE